MRKLLSLLLLITAVSCNKSLPEIKNLDLEAWKNDKNACGNYRSENIETLRTQKESLFGLKESQIIELLGRPDRNELYKRNQKFFHYNLEAGAACSHAKENASRMIIRFNAMGLAKEIAID